MPALGQLAPWRHLVVGGAVAGIGLATLTGVIGEDHSERFDSKQVVVTPAGENGLRVREVVDEDFGNKQRHGYQRLVPNDFGVPIDVTASSPDAPDDVEVSSIGLDTRIRVGDPDQTISGQHRYVLNYTYPDARLSSGELALDIIGTDETLETKRFEVVVTGLELAETTCNVGSFGDVGGCELVDDGTTYRVVFEPLEPGEGITIGGRIVGRRDPVDIEPPALPEPRPNRRVPLAAGTTALGALAGGGVYVWARRRGRNEVFAGGAADAAFGVSMLPPPAFPPPGQGSATAADAGAPPPPPTPTAPTPSSTRLVADADLGDLATIEFVPPQGVDPWLGSVLLNERLGNETVAAWMSGHAARDVLTVTRNEDESVTLSVGPRFGTAPELDQRTLQRMLGESGEIRLGRYSKSFAAGWAEIASRQQKFVDQSGFWKQPLHGASTVGSILTLVIVVVVFVGIYAGRTALRAMSILDSPVAAIALGALVPAALAYGVYRTLLPARTAIGSALALRTESFRRFLAASEAQHVEWAWTHGMLREYSAWAVALGTADAWESAMRQSTVPPAEFNPAPILLYHHAALLSSTRVAPSSSGSGGGGFSGGFSGGSVGGGGGGGSSGSW